jgi:hypothetical protein
MRVRGFCQLHFCVISPFYQAKNQGSVGVDKLLVALWHAEFQCRYGLYRTGLVLLADIALEFGMTKKSRRLLEEIMPQVRRVSNMYESFWTVHTQFSDYKW